MDGENKENGFLKNVIKKEVIIALLIGILIGLAIMFFTKPNETLASANGVKITKIDLADEIKENYPDATLNTILDKVDRAILSQKYKLDDDMKAEVKAQADEYIEMFANYGMSEEEFLEQYGFNSYDDFIAYLTLDYQRYLYYADYLATLIGEEEIQKYYDENVYGDINTQHILVQTTDDITDKQAKEIAAEIIKRLNNGENFDDIAKEYKDKYEDAVITEDLGYISFNNELVSAFTEALLEMKENSYSQEPVKTEYGYHVIYRKDQAEKPTLEKIKKDVVYTIYEARDDIEAEEQTRVLIKMREECGLKINDAKIKEAYEEYLQEYIQEGE